MSSRGSGSSRSTSTVLTAVNGGAQPAQEREVTLTLTGTPRRSVRQRPALVVLSGPHEGEVFKLKNDGTMVIGRSQNAFIRLTDDGVSRTHARPVARDGQLTIEDMDSHNGTFVRGDRVRRRALAPEDMIRIGGFTVLKYCLIDSVEEELRRRLLAAALRDPLTGVHNRRHFDERLAAECAAARRHERPLSLLMVDVDDFKAINDRHGHRVGDAVLRAVAQALLEGVRREDAVFRYGGEEFAILLRETGLAGAVRLADRLRKRVAKLRAPGAAAHGARITVTISIGAAAYTPDLADGDLIERADAGLYRAKRQGKDRVVSAG